MKILVLNSGSSSLKASLFSVAGGERVLPAAPPLWQAQVDWDSEGGAELKVRGGANGVGIRQDDVNRADSGSTGEQSARSDTTTQTLSDPSFASALKSLLNCLWEGDRRVVSGPEDISVVGHRIVHGGTKYTQSALIDKTVLADLRSLIELAPAHEPANIEGIEIVGRILPAVPQVAVFDTAFHRSMPETAKIYPCPYDWYEKLGIQRFGFHGISHQYCAGRAAEILQRDLSSLKIITCHLGNGASLCAIKEGKSQYTTMGYTPMAGLVMGARSGSVDPGIILHLLSNNIYSANEISQALNHESGLKGISGVTSDMKEIERLASSGHKRAQLAFDIYINHLAAAIASLVPGLEGLDALVFTGGVGENSKAVRACVGKKLAYLGIVIDPEKNDSCENDGDISMPSASVQTLMIRAREDLSIANQCLGLLTPSALLP